MKFLRKNTKAKKVILVISDLHMGAGAYYNGKKNPLEDFRFDRELCEFLEYYSSNEYANTTVELIINGDFFDLLAIPFVQYFDDEFWSEKAALEKLKICMEGHEEVMDALEAFLSSKNKSLTFIIGNHDFELLFDSLKEYFINFFKEDIRERIKVLNNETPYSPNLGIYFQHGHEYESAHAINYDEIVIESDKGEKYLLPTWGSYYVTNIICRYKEDRDYINSIRPIRNLLIYGMFFDTFFTLKFMFHNAYYFFMMRVMYYLRKSKTIKDFIHFAFSELELFQDYEYLTQSFFEKYKDAKVLMVGHTHEPVDREYNDNTRFINTGTWTEMTNLGLKKSGFGKFLTYAHVNIFNLDYNLETFHDHVEIELQEWKGHQNQPFKSFK